MNSIRQWLEPRPGLTRVLPFVIFLGLTFCQLAPGETARYWVYAAKMFVCIGLIWLAFPLIAELEWRFSWEAVLVGAAVFAAWVGLDGFYPKFQEAGEIWNPLVSFGSGVEVAWCFIVVRLVGSTFLVPMLEEVFYRSFLYRWIAKPEFQSVSLGTLHWKPFLVTATVFGLAHREWLAGILCGLAYQWLVVRKGRLGDALTAHATTNLLLGLWIVGRGEWRFWS
ncbi:MAG: CAAX prenyl protease-like protein [Candidatus Binatia bacterium]|jgi:CAAX prenyl protease-like protein